MWMLVFVQNWINGFGRRHNCGCLIRSIRFCLNTSIHYFVVQLVVREPIKKEKIELSPDPFHEEIYLTPLAAEIVFS